VTETNYGGNPQIRHRKEGFAVSRRRIQRYCVRGFPVPKRRTSARPSRGHRAWEGRNRCVVLISMEPPSKHQASAAPLVPNSTGVRYFCSFEDDAFRW